MGRASTSVDFEHVASNRNCAVTRRSLGERYSSAVWSASFCADGACRGIDLCAGTLESGIQPWLDGHVRVLERAVIELVGLVRDRGSGHFGVGNP